jgi:hypothetical protein
MEGDLRHFVDRLQVLALIDPEEMRSIHRLIESVIENHYSLHPEDRPAGWAD